MHHARYLGAQRLLLALTMAIPVRASSETNAGAGHEVVLQFNEAQIRAGGIETQLVVHEFEFGRTSRAGRRHRPPAAMLVVAAPAAGLVETLLVVIDEDVKQGAPIATLKSWDLIEAQRSFLHALSAANLAAEKLRRDEQLFKEHIIAERRLIVTRAEAIQARSALEERKQILSLVGMSDEDVASLQRERTLASSLQVRAPIAGTILQRHGKTGERVQASTPLVTIACLDPIWVNLQIPIIRAAALESVDRVHLPIAGLDGKLIRIGRSVDAPTQSVTAVAEFRTWVAARCALARRCRRSCALMATRTQWRVPADARSATKITIGCSCAQPDGFRRDARDPTFRNAAIRVRPGAFKADERVATRGLLTLLAELAEAESDENNARKTDPCRAPATAARLSSPRSALRGSGGRSAISNCRSTPFPTSRRCRCWSPCARRASRLRSWKRASPRRSSSPRKAFPTSFECAP